MKSTKANNAMMLLILGKMLITVMIISLILANFWSNLTILKILNALKMVTAVAKLFYNPSISMTRPISALTTINMSKRFQLDWKYPPFKATNLRNISKLNTNEKYQFKYFNPYYCYTGIW
jgi:hypothetical protein